MTLEEKIAETLEDLDDWRGVRRALDVPYRQRTLAEKKLELRLEWLRLCASVAAAFEGLGRRIGGRA